MKLRSLCAAVLVLATLLAAAGAAAQAPGVVTFLGEPGSVTINGRAAPEGTTILAETPTGSGRLVRVAADGSWSLTFLTDPTPLTFTVDRLPVAGGPVDRSEAGERQLTLAASSLGVPPPVMVEFHDAAGSATIGGHTAPEGATVAAWANGRMLGATPVYGGAWDLPIRAGTTGIRFTVDGLPDAGGPYSSALDGVPYWITLATPARGTNLGTARVGGSFGSVLTGGLKWPARPGALITATSDGRVVGRTTIRADGGWSIEVPVGTSNIHFEVNRSLAVDAPYAVTHPGVEISVQLFSWTRVPGWEHDEPIGALPTNALQHELERAHRFSGSGFPVGIIRVLDRGAVDPDSTLTTFGGAEISSGSWSFVFSPDDIPALVLELHSGGVAYRTAAHTLEAGGSTALTTADFTALRLPHTFRGVELRSGYVNALDADGDGGARRPTIGGAWALSLQPDIDRPGAIRLSAEIGGERRWTREFALRPGGETRVSADEFSITSNPIAPQDFGVGMAALGEVPETVEIRLRAQPLTDGRIEFGVRIEGETEPLTIDRRFLPATPRVNRWLLSSRMRLNNAVEGHVIARRLADGRTEFGFRVTGRGDVFPASRFVSADAAAGRWLSSSVISIRSVVSTE